MAKKYNSKKVESLEHWLLRVTSDDDSLLFRDVHFDMLNHPIRSIKSPQVLLKESCRLIEKVLSLGERLELTDEWLVFVNLPLPWDDNDLQLWEESHWEKIGIDIEPPSLFLLKGGFIYNDDGENYSIHVQLPFSGFPNIDPLYRVHRSKAELEAGEPGSARIYLLSTVLLAKT